MTGARKLFEETLFDWVDQYSRILEEQPDITDKVGMVVMKDR